MNDASGAEIFEEKFVTGLFDRMSKTYGITNYLSSFGMTERWRKQCIKEISWDKNIQNGCDLMSGMGETWHLIMEQQNVNLVAVDISANMNEKARANLDRNKSWHVTILQENVLKNTITPVSADFVVSAFGLKTFSPESQEALAREIARVLRPGGQLSMIEISRPSHLLMRIPYKFYIKYMIPLIGRLFMGNSEDYRMLGRYCDRFIDCSHFAACLQSAGIHVVMKKYFFGCASGVVGTKV